MALRQLWLWWCYSLVWWRYVNCDCDGITAQCDGVTSIVTVMVLQLSVMALHQLWLWWCYSHSPGGAVQDGRPGRNTEVTGLDELFPGWPAPSPGNCGQVLGARACWSNTYNLACAGFSLSPDICPRCTPWGALPASTKAIPDSSVGVRLVLNLTTRWVVFLPKRSACRSVYDYGCVCQSVYYHGYAHRSLFRVPQCLW